MPDDENINARFIKIPSMFYSDLTNEPFKTCIHCNKDLLRPGTLYMIEKAFVQTQPHRTRSTILEYAMCYDCWQKTQKTLSKESLQRINAYFAEHVDLGKRYETFQHETDFNAWVQHCLVTGEDVDEMQEFQVACQCDGEYMALHHFPYLLSGSVADELMELLSAQTLDELDDFKRRLTTPSPDLEELFGKKKPLFV
ncbi:MAG: hypothetical protein KDC05_15480 [Bacteroidales bacterium]|nr:hypothetical protein [Bacteroidales bacterium]